MRKIRRTNNPRNIIRLRLLDSASPMSEPWEMLHTVMWILHFLIWKVRLYQYNSEER